MDGAAELWYNAFMTAKALKEIMEQVEAWPEEARQELADIAREIDAGLQAGIHHATPAELAGIDRGLRAAREGRFAKPGDVDALFGKHKRV